ncbi:hypothetical protein [Anaerovibrio lipolyticus]|uniref:hypothetical protein n=1 Tax=Anaerovibrio lipolyticus TaxID=82374 RepID=UPI00117877A6|nr:hypothetical protein [Anaerovibrio lipolyticus]
MDSIKPCCNCGGLEAEMISENIKNPLYWLRCKACGYPLSGTLAGPYMYWREAQKAQEEWNRRADSGSKRKA